jgi:prepilin-type processing-associated H-X9-DG protein
VRKFLECGDLKHGFARVRCPRCREELFVPFSCRGRCFCPSCHQKRALEKAGWVSEHVCAEVPHRQFVFTIPKRLRIYFRFDRRLLGQLTGLHPGGGNAFFLDGHVGWRKFEKLKFRYDPHDHVNWWF